jgi:hypothetical protein
MVAFRLVIVPVEKVRVGPRSTVGFGLTVNIDVFGKPVQPLADGVTVIAALTGDEPVLIALNDPILPVPLDDKPIEGALFVQLKLVPSTLPEKMIALVENPSQIF